MTHDNAALRRLALSLSKLAPSREADAEIARAAFPTWRVSRDPHWSEGNHDAWCIRRDGRLDQPCDEALPFFTGSRDALLPVEETALYHEICGPRSPLMTGEEYWRVSLMPRGGAGGRMIVGEGRVEATARRAAALMAMAEGFRG